MSTSPESAPDLWQTNPGSYLEQRIEELEAANQVDIAGWIGEVVDFADHFRGGPRERLLTAASRVVHGMEEAVALAPAGRPGVIDRYDLQNRDSDAWLERYRRIFQLLGFTESSAKPRRDHGVRIVERWYESRYFSPVGQKMVLSEFIEGDESVTLFAELADD